MALLKVDRRRRRACGNWWETRSAFCGEFSKRCGNGGKLLWLFDFPAFPQRVSFHRPFFLSFLLLFSFFVEMRTLAQSLSTADLWSLGQPEGFSIRIHVSGTIHKP